MMLGRDGVGKSALTIRFITGTYEPNYDPTIEDSYRKQIIINGEPLLYDVLDTAGYSVLRDMWIRESNVFILCFAINDLESWRNVELLRNKVIQVKDNQKWGMVLTATKCDLEYGRKISRDEIVAKAYKWNLPVIETSAKEGKNVDFVYEQGVYAYWLNSQTNCASMEI